MVLDQALLDFLPQGAIQLAGQEVAAFNRGALAWFPLLTIGGRAPEELLGLAQSGAEAASLSLQGRTCLVSCRRQRDSILFLLCQGEEGLPLTSGQLDGVLYQLRQQLGDICFTVPILFSYLKKEEEQVRLNEVNRRLYQMIRLTENLDFLREGEEDFVPVAMDLVLLCNQVTQETSSLLGELGITLSFYTDCPVLMIQGSPGLLRRMLLGLIANSAQAAPGGQISLRLGRLDQRAIITMSDSGQLAENRSLPQLLTGQSEGVIPGPGQGAGLGLAVVRRIVELHEGSLLVRRGVSGGLETTIALPKGEPGLGLSVKSPAIERGGGLSPLLVELSPVLPPRFFQEESLPED